MKRFLLVLGILLAFGAKAWAEPEVGLVVWVVDGDTVVVDMDGKQKRVRFPGIDAPELGRPYAVEAAKFVKAKLLDKQVEVRPLPKNKHDRYGRLLADVVVDGERVSEALVREGLAWWWPKYAAADTKLGDAQDEARKLKKNLWSASVAEDPGESEAPPAADTE